LIYPKIQLKAARVNANLSQEEAAEKLNISKATLQNYEAGKTIPQWDMVKKIGELYKFPTDFIFFGSDYALSVNTKD
jgi:DNA-binding XRE family transcriptional regulator